MFLLLVLIQLQVFGTLVTPIHHFEEDANLASMYAQRVEALDLARLVAHLTSSPAV
jgi:hypothetical protein